ncbi:hypothetical protein KSU69_15365 [Phocaeicola vulgatus]|jgi:hypothetical protein|uniref:hypothetical protein n=1 Tax=Phocaeicola vulgatus TaxID=821 RepID=UPI000E3F5F8A|nr:hypothetical protein [Phocaeicola vulgatus]RGD24476.1 hypothetical protein DW646_14255 [Bacteroides sp. AM23-18]MBU9066883.1 hypothetical protein [Phocaeicola vulgatus]MBV3184529.1 hypothetical protein [Phocaeicola vulgatus]MBV3188600.1 hypothetical protein [Phocaeicola vulgatus]MBV3195879.1 hypothetical protein [Phocaeicola vulgatus]
MDNNEVYALFEDIKNNLKGINGKLENTSKVANEQSSIPPPAVNLKPIKELFDSSAKEHQAQTKAMLTKFGEAEVHASNRILHLLRDLKESFARSSEEREDRPQEHIHRHSFDIRSSKVFSLLVGMGIVCSLSVWGNIELWKSKRQYADDALKFRVIRSWGGCNANHILWLNDVFDIHRNEEAIEWIRQESDGYDRNLKVVSDSLMQEKLKNVH